MKVAIYSNSKHIVIMKMKREDEIRQKYIDWGYDLDDEFDRIEVNDDIFIELKSSFYIEDSK